MRAAVLPLLTALLALAACEDPKDRARISALRSDLSSAEQMMATLRSNAAYHSRDLYDARVESEARFALVRDEREDFVGVTCDAPSLPRINPLSGPTKSFGMDDVIEDAAEERRERIAERRGLETALADNHAVLRNPAFPYADICIGIGRRELEVVRFVRTPPAYPPRSLHEAARRGDVADIDRLMDPEELATPDAFGLTPLAWAVWRKRPEIIEHLLKAGADSLAGPTTAPGEYSAAWFAASQGDHRTLYRFRRSPGVRGVRFPGWPHSVIRAALASHDPRTTSVVFDSLHEPVTIDEAAEWTASDPQARALISGIGKFPGESRIR